MLRLGIFISALIGVFLIALSLMPRLLSPSVYRTQALIGLTRALGQPVDAAEGAAITFLPRPRLQLIDIRVRGDGADTDDVLLSADTATFDLSGRALATGRFLVEAVELDRPVMSLSRGEDHAVTFGAAPLFTGLTGSANEAASLISLKMTGGEIHYYDAPFAQNYRFDIDTMEVRRVSGYAFEAKGSVLHDNEANEVAISFVPNANPGGERGFNIDISRADGSALNLRGAIDEKFGENLIIREDLDWKLTAEDFHHAVFDRLAIADGQGVTFEARLLSDREGYDFRGLTLTRSNGEQMRGSARFVPDDSAPMLDVNLTGRGFSLSDSAAGLPLEDWTALLPGAVADLSGLTVNFDIAAQDFRLPNGEVVERLLTSGTLQQEGLTLSSLKGNTQSGLTLDLTGLALNGPEDLSFEGRLVADDPARLTESNELADLIGSLGRLDFEGEVTLKDGGLQIVEGTVTTAQGDFNVSGLPFSLNPEQGFGEAGIELVTDNLDLNAWTSASPDNAAGATPDLVDQGRAMVERMRALGTQTLSLEAEQANLGGRILTDVEAGFSTREDGVTDVTATFAEDDGTQFEAIGSIGADGETLDFGKVTVRLNDDPRAGEKLIERFAPAATENQLVADILDRLAVDSLSVSRTDASRPWELTLRSGDTELTGSDFDSDGTRFWSFTSSSASDLFQTLDIPFSPAEDAGDVALSGLLNADELVGKGRLLGAALVLQQHDEAQDGEPAAGQAFKLYIEHPDAQQFLGHLGINLDLSSNGPITLELSVSRLDQNYGYQVEAVLGDDIEVSGNGFYGFATRTLDFNGTVNRLEVLPLLNALFLSDAEDSMLSPALAALSGRIGLNVGQLGPLTDAEIEIEFSPGRYSLNTVNGTFAEGLLAGGMLTATGDVLAGDDIFADLTVAVTDAAPEILVANDTALRFGRLSFQSNSFQARSQSMGDLLAQVDASFDVTGEATLDLALTAINAASTLEPGVWNDFLSQGEGINAYEDLRSLFFDGEAALDGVVQVRDGALQSNTLALKGRRGTLLTKGVVELDTLSGRGFLPDTPLRIELYRAEDQELVEQVLVLQGPLTAPDTLEIGR
ncbi:MAG: hypothetical protein CBC49_010840 [Alphaproteobacteria bacterium TMED89]|nr:hypothetical protein [Rhodospirillaceae bacterium]RPH10228.1 MAG: hypothetical protein CBC49_010840 [Alphaproteobacteria bacterium TMED89]